MRSNGGLNVLFWDVCAHSFNTALYSNSKAIHTPAVGSYCMLTKTPTGRVCYRDSRCAGTLANYLYFSNLTSMKLTEEVLPQESTRGCSQSTNRVNRGCTGATLPSRSTSPSPVLDNIWFYLHTNVTTES